MPIAYACRSKAPRPCLKCMDAYGIKCLTQVKQDGVLHGRRFVFEAAAVGVATLIAADSMLMPVKLMPVELRKDC